MQSSTLTDTNGGDVELAYDRHDSETSSSDGEEDDIQRTSNKWRAAAFNITAIIGIGVLCLPQSMVFLTWYGGTLLLVLAFVFTLFTMWKLMVLHEFELLNMGKRYGTYRELGERAFGYKWSTGLVLPMQLVVEISLDIVFTITAGEAMNRIYENHFDLCSPIHMFIWFTIFASIEIFLSWKIQTFESLAWIAIPAAIMSVCYSTIAWISVVALRDPNLNPKYTLPSSTISVDTQSELVTLKPLDEAFRVFNAIGVVAFAYAAHNIVLEIQDGIPLKQRKSWPSIPTVSQSSDPEVSPSTDPGDSPSTDPGDSPSIPRTSKRKGTSIPEMKKAVLITYAVVALCYFPMGITVYAIHGNQMSPNILSFIQYQLKAPKGLIDATNLMLIIHLIGNYQIFAMPVFKQLENWGSRYWFQNCSLPVRNKSRYFIRFCYIVITTGVAMILPYFSPLLGFFGGFALAPTTYILPCVMWIKLKKPSRWSFDWCLNMAFIILGTLLMLVAINGGLYLLIQQFVSDNYKLWKQGEWKNSSFYSYKFEACN